MRTTIALFFAVSVLVGCSEPESEHSIPWEEVQPLLETCKVVSIYQGHDRRVMLTLEDESQVHTRSPALDDIIYLIGDMESCDHEIAEILE